MARLHTLVVLLLFTWMGVYGQQQDVDFHLSNQFLAGKTVLKVKRDFKDPYLWVLAKNNEVYRINSQTLIVDNFTATFSAYNNLQFIDIAGRSKDTVFIATNSTNVVQYTNGQSKLITAADGIPGTVNSVGIAENIVFQYPRQPPSLMIATDKGFRLYDMDGQTIYDKSDDAESKVYEATYRTEFYKDSSALTSDFVTGDTIQYQPVTFIPLANGSINTEFLWEGGNEFGYNIHTAVPVFESIDLYDAVFTNLFWGNSRGMFQNYSDDSFHSIYAPAGHYLNGINVNKITTIYGLAAFGTGEPSDAHGIIKQNLLSGTDKGLYFSSSIYTSSPSLLRQFSLFHYDELGNIRVNDICVNQQLGTTSNCEDGVWVACDNGLYLIKPDYSKSVNGLQFHAVSFKDQADDVSSLQICDGTSATAVINTQEYHAEAMQWYKDGQELPGQSLSSLVISADGDYYAVLYDPCQNVHLETNHLKVQVIKAPIFTFDYPDKLQYCDSTSTTLKVVNNPLYQYRWYTNGVLNGNAAYNYTVTQSGKYKVEVSACTDTWVPSKEIEVDLINLPVPVISADKPKYCAGDVAVLTVDAPVDPNYTINWYKDGKIIQTDQNNTSINLTDDGNYSVTLISTIAPCTKSSVVQPVVFTPAPVFTFNYPDKLVYCAGTPVNLVAKGSDTYQYRWYAYGMLNENTSATQDITQSGKYKVEVSACDGSWVPSKEVQVDLISIPVPVIKADKPAYCIGDNATMSISVANDPAYTINWYKDNTLLSANVNQTSLTTNTSGNYTVVITSNEANTDGTTCTQTSATQNVVFNPLPTLSIQKIVKTTLCDGQTVDLKVSYDNGVVSWSNGQNGDQITVSTSATYKATVTSTAGCTSDASINVRFFPNPILNLPNPGVCVQAHKTATITAPSGMTSYLWNGQAGAQTYIADHPQTVTLTVTDPNGCTATQDIQVADECPDIVIPNAFTPNGDGINDTWDIQGLEYDATALVRIFTRYGQQIFESKGYAKPWDGTSKGKQLPSGVYYYIVNVKNGAQTYSGSVTIIY